MTPTLTLWPVPAAPRGVYHPAAPSQIGALESAFEKIYASTACVLFPSGRAALTAALEYFGMTRTHHVLVADFSSHCVLEAVARFAMPTLTRTTATKLFIANHQWGYVTRLLQEDASATGALRGGKVGKLQPVAEGKLRGSDESFRACFHPALPVEGALLAPVIEDGCDSLLCNSAALFPNHGACELLSLPKIFGTAFGGLLLCRDVAMKNALIEIRARRDPRLGEIQYLLRQRGLDGDAFSYALWEGSESLNGHLAASAIDDIAQQLDTLPALIRHKRQRLQTIRDAQFAPLREVAADSPRLPVVVPLTLDTAHVTQLTNAGFVPLIRHFHQGTNMVPGTFVPSLLLPIHQGVSDADFDRIVTLLHEK